MRFLLFALHAARGPAPPRTVLKATTNHYELNQELSRARAPDELPASCRGPRARLQRRQRGHGPAAPRDGQATTGRARARRRRRGGERRRRARQERRDVGRPAARGVVELGAREARPEPAGFVSEADFTDRPAHVRPRIVDSGLGPRDGAKARGDLRRRLRSGLVARHAPRPGALRRRRRARHGRPERPRRRNHYFRARHRKVKRPAALKALCRRLADPSVDWNGQDVANSCWACASLDADAPRLFSAAAAFVAQNASQLEPRGVATLAWSFAKERQGRSAAAARASDDAVALKALAARAAEVARFFDARSLALASWAFAVAARNDLIEPSDACFQSLERDAVARLAPGLDARDLAGVAWALASAGRADRASYEALAARARALPRKAWTGRALANCLWAFAVQTSGCAALPLAQELEKAVVELAPSLSRAGRGGDLLVAVRHRGRPRRGVRRGLRRRRGRFSELRERRGPGPGEPRERRRRHVRGRQRRSRR